MLGVVVESQHQIDSGLNGPALRPDHPSTRILHAQPRCKRQPVMRIGWRLSAVAVSNRLLFR